MDFIGETFDLYYICRSCDGDGFQNVSDPCHACGGTGKIFLGVYHFGDNIFSSHTILEALDSDEYDALTDTEKEGVKILLSCGRVDLNDGKAGKVRLWNWFGAESTTVANLTALITQLIKQEERMEDKLYKCPNCGKESQDSDFVLRRRNYVSCPACGHIWVIEEDQIPEKPKRSHRKK